MQFAGHCVCASEGLRWQALKDGAALLDDFVARSKGSTLVAAFAHGSEDLNKCALMSASQLVHASRENADRMLPVLLDIARSLAAEPAGARDASSKTPANKQLLAVLKGVTTLVAAVGISAKADAALIGKVVHGIVDVLASPSVAVQEIAADALQSLAEEGALSRQLISEMLTQFLASLHRGGKFGEPTVLAEEPRGAAFGVAALVKATGAPFAKVAGVFQGLKDAVVQKAHPHAREGALLAWQLLCKKLGRVVEPYTVQARLLSLLLVCCDDKAVAVKDAAESTAVTMVGNMCPQALRLFLPSVLRAMTDRSWKIKSSALRVLAATATQAPLQMVVELPMVMVKLTDCLEDTHPKVQKGL